MSTFVHVRWVGGSSNVHVDILSIIQIKLKMPNFWTLVGSSPIVLHQSKLQYFPHPPHFYQLIRYILLILGGDFGRWSVFECPRGQRVGGQLNVHVCPLGVGG